MRIGVAGFDREIDIGRKGYIPGDLLPHKVEGIDRRPEICACRGNFIGTRGWVTHKISWRSNTSDIRLTFKHAQRLSPHTFARGCRLELAECRIHLSDIHAKTNGTR